MTSDASIVFNSKMLTRQRATPDRPVGVAVIALSQTLTDKPAATPVIRTVNFLAPEGEISGLSSP